jgi:hypothetical protein
MRTRDLLAEMRAASLAVTPADVDELVAAGVDPADAGWLIGLARIAHIADTQLYQPDDHGAWAFITPARRGELAATPESRDPALSIRRGEVMDLIAWDPQTPGQWALRVGAADWLGCVEPQFLDPPGLARCRTMSRTQKPPLRSRPSLMPTVQSGSLNSVFSVAARSQ